MASKGQAITALDEAYRNFQAVIAGIDEPHGTWEGAVGAWSVVNVLQHVDGWLMESIDILDRLAPAAGSSSEGPDYSNVDAWNAKFVETRGGQSLAEARAMVEAAHAKFRAAVAALPDERLGEGGAVYNLAVLNGEHYDEHRGQIEAFLSAP